MNDKFRMIQWLAIAAVFYALALTVFAAQPQLQTLAWKLGNVTVAGFVGYWIDRRAFRKAITPYSPPLEQIRRAVIMAAAMLSVSLGL
ncbi:MAG: putative holin [Burkholderiales bacterium]